MPLKKRILRSGLAAILILSAISIAHYYIFSQESNCILIKFSDLENDGNLYYEKGLPLKTLDSLREIIKAATARNHIFWGKLTVQPKFIFCTKENNYKKYGDAYGGPACTHTKLGACIVISAKGKDVDIISHELCHAELYQRVGFINYHFRIPAWFDEGLAMQLDNRIDYSEDSLKEYSRNIKKLPQLTKLDTRSQFAGNNEKEQILNYAFSKNTLGKWYSKEKLNQFVIAINKGKIFNNAYAD